MTVTNEDKMPSQTPLGTPAPGTIAGRDEKGKPLTQEEVDERTAKKLEEDEKKTDKVKEQLKGEREEAEKAAEQQAKADEDFRKKQEKAAEKEAAKEEKAEQRAEGRVPPPAPQGRHR